MWSRQLNQPCTTEPLGAAPYKSEELQQKEQQQRKQQQDQLLLMCGVKVDQLNADRFLMLDRSLGGTLQRRKNKVCFTAACPSVFSDSSVLGC